MKKYPDIKRVEKNVVVLDKKGVKIFDMPYSEQTVAVAHDIYMYEKYADRLPQ